ncbi:MAG: hypothetical protein WAX69_25980 [Victivallales bacterium]
MKSTKILLVFALAATATTAIAAETVLIDKSTCNGGFESATIQPWRVNQDASPANAVEKDKGKASEGEMSFHVMSKGGVESGHAWDSICQDIANVDPANGTYFTLSYDIRGIGELQGLSTYAQLVFFDASGKEVLATSALGEMPIKEGSWLRWTPSAVKAPSDWSGGRVQLRIGTLIRKGSADIIYEAFFDNVSLIQSDKPQADKPKTVQ